MARKVPFTWPKQDWRLFPCTALDHVVAIMRKSQSRGLGQQPEAVIFELIHGNFPTVVHPTAEQTLVRNANDLITQLLVPEKSSAGIARILYLADSFWRRPISQAEFRLLSRPSCVCDAKQFA
jgi:hypothetical protein